MGINYIRWIRILYTNPKITIKNNGWLTEYINVSRSVKQGCPVSALLFILCIEMLSTKLKVHKNIEGIKINSLVKIENDEEFITTQYADDIILTLKNEQSLNEALTIIEHFSNNAGPRLNLCKSEIIGTGKYQKREYISNIKVTTNAKCLGIYIGHDIKYCNEKNWAEKISKLEETLNGWKRRHLTLKGKVLILKVLGLSQLIFSVQNTAIPEGKIKEIDQIIYKFLWNHSERLKRKILIGDIQNGGLNMVDTQCFFRAIKAKWIGRIMNNKGKWNIIGKTLINSFAGDQLLLKINVPDTDYIKKLPPFYRQVIESYITAKALPTEKPKTTNELLSQPIWCNKYFVEKIRHKTNPIYISNWIKSGILYVKDLNFKDGKLDELFMQQQVKNKANILVEIVRINHVLKPYSKLIREIPCCSRPTRDMNLQYIGWSSKQFYKYQINHISETSEFIKVKQYIPGTTDLTIQQTIRVKIMNKYDNKLSEFNYKMLHNILVCAKLLSKWLNIDHNCALCRIPHDVPHMLYYCDINRTIWTKVGQILKFDIQLKHVLLYYEHTEHTTMLTINQSITIIAYNIYKYWLICHNEQKKPTNQSLKAHIIVDLQMRIAMLKEMNKYPTLITLLIKLKNTFYT